MVTSRSAHPRVARLGAAAAVALLLSGCAIPGVPMAPPPSQPPGSTGGTATPEGWPSSRPPLQTAPSSPGVPAQVSEARLQAIRDDLTGRGVTGTPQVESAEAVTWPDSSLGCPSPGMSYTQALVDGMRVIVTVDGEQYDYRFGSGDQPKLCTSGK